MHTSFQPDGRWFCFDETGRTLTKNLPTKTHALNWIARQMAKAKA
jgi:hypothetical protein